MDPNTLDHFREWAGGLILDSGDRWVLEPFQEKAAADIFAGLEEVWLVLPEGNGKTTFLAGIALYHAANTLSAFVPIAAASREQAEIMYRQAEGFVIRTPGLGGVFKCQEGYRRIKTLEGGSRIQVYAADDRTADGVIPTLALLDELHRHRDLRLYRTWRGKIAKRDGQILTISTAGEPGGEFEETRAKIIKEATDLQTNGKHGEHIRAAAEGIVLHDWSVRNRADADDMDIVAAANPRAAITPEILRKKHVSPTMSDAHWLRFVCNIATRMSGDGIKPEEWDALTEEGLTVPEGCWAVGWLDLGWKIDTTAMGILAWESRERRLITGVKVLEPPVEEGDIVRGMVGLQRKYSLDGWVYDPNAGGQQMAQLLDKGEHPQQDGVQFEFFEHTQDNAPMSLAARRFDEGIRAGWIRHDGDETLKKHVLNGVRKGLGGEKYRFDRPPDAKGERRRLFPNDALIGAVMGHSFAVAHHETSQEPIAIWGAPR